MRCSCKHSRQKQCPTCYLNFSKLPWYPALCPWVDQKCLNCSCTLNIELRANGKEQNFITCRAKEKKDDSQKTIDMEGKCTQIFDHKVVLTHWYWKKSTGRHSGN